MVIFVAHNSEGQYKTLFKEKLDLLFHGEKH